MVLASKASSAETGDRDPEARAMIVGGMPERSPVYVIRLGLVLILAAVATVAGWRLLDRTVTAADVEGPLHGVTYAPWARDQDPIAAKSSGIMSFLRTAFTDEPSPPVKPRKEQIESDFAMLAGKVSYVRTYRTTDGGEFMPETAARVGLKLVPGAWIYSANEAKLQFGRDAADVNAEETRTLIRMANQNPNIERVMVGNENILRWDGQKDQRDPNAVSPAQLIREIRNVKRNVKVPVSTAEPWHIWLHYPELAKEVDYLAVHILPYWDEQSSRDAARIPQGQDRPAQAGLSEQEHHRHRGRLAVERRVAAQPGAAASSSAPRRPSRPGTSATWWRG